MIVISKCTVDEECLTPVPEVAGIYFRNKNKPIPNIDDVFALLELVQIDVNNIRMVPYGPYWDFLDEVADNIATGKWKMHPYNWKAYIMNASYVPLPEAEVERRRDILRNKCINMLRDANLPTNGGLINKQILLRWVRNPNGFQDILSTVTTMVELNKLFSKKGK